MNSHSKIYQFELDTSKLDFSDRLYPFGIFQIKLPSNLRQISYYILSENYCLGMQVFLSNSLVKESQLFIGDSNIRLDLDGAANDLLDHILETDIFKSNSLAVRYQEFNEGNQDSSDVYLSFWCPFWDSTRSTKDMFEIEIKGIVGQTVSPELLIELGQDLFKDIDDFQIDNIEKKLLDIKKNPETYSTILFKTQEFVRSTQVSKVGPSKEGNSARLFFFLQTNIRILC